MRRITPLHLLIALAMLNFASTALAADAAPAGWQANKGEIARDGDTYTFSGPGGSLLYKKIDGDFSFAVRFTKLTGTAALVVAEQPDADIVVQAVRPGQNDEPAQAELKWAKIVRKGRHSGAYTSSDGRRFRHTDMGRTLPSNGPVYVGIRLLGGSVDQPTTAQFDQIELVGNPTLPYRTSYVGNTLPGPITDAVSFNMTGLYVASDGTCYTTSFFEEQGHCIAAYKDARNILPAGKTPTAGIAVTRNSNHIFTSHRGGFQRLELDLLSNRQFVEVAKDVKGHSAVRGLAATDAEVFVGNRIDNRIQVYNAETLQPLRQWSFERPGPICLDPQGRLWVIREGFNETAYEFLDGPYPHQAEIVCIDTENGNIITSFTGPEIPTGIAADDRGPNEAMRLLIADNGKDQQVKIYTQDGKVTGTVGTRGGIFAGTPGAVTDGKLHGLTGVGSDADGNIYVSSTGWPFMYISPGTMANQVTLRKFTPEAINNQEPTAAWKLESLAYIFDGGTLDPRDETKLYGGADQIFTMDWSKSAGKEGTYTAFTANLRDFRDEAVGRRGRCAPLVRWIGGKKFLILRRDDLYIYRFEPEKYGELAVPCAAVSACAGRAGNWPANAPDNTRQPWMWTDGSNGQPLDGIAQAEEYVTRETIRSPGGIRWDIDENGDIWHTGWYTNYLVHLKFTGLENGVPAWREREVVDGPPPFTSIQWSRYNAEEDKMVLAGATLRYRGSADIRGQTSYVAVYPNWSKGNRKSEIEFSLAEPDTYYFDGAVGFDVVGDFLYTTGRPGNVKVYDLRHGNCVIEFFPGPEVNGSGGYFDNSESAVQAFRLSTGEYVALAQGNAYCKILMYRWKPDYAPAAKPDIAPEVWAIGGSSQTDLYMRTSHCGMIEGYNVYRSSAIDGQYTKLNDQPVALPHYTDAAAANGTEYFYKMSIVNAADEGPLSAAVSALPQKASAQFVGIDAETQGDWKGTYGKEGFYIVGDWTSPNNPTMPEYVKYNGGAFYRKGGFKPRPGTRPYFLLHAQEGATKRASFPPGSGYTDQDQRHLLEFTDGKTHRLSIYSAGHPNGFTSLIQIYDGSTGELLDEREVVGRGEKQGRYVSWNVSGYVDIRYTRMPKGFGNYVSGFFFDPVQ